MRLIDWLKGWSRGEKPAEKEDKRTLRVDGYALLFGVPASVGEEGLEAIGDVVTEAGGILSAAPGQDGGLVLMVTSDEMSVIAQVAWGLAMLEMGTEVAGEA